MPNPADPVPPTSPSPIEGNRSGLFTPPVAETSGRGRIITVAVVFVVLGLAAAVFFGRHRTAAPQTGAIVQADPYAGNLAFSQLAMSQSTSLSGGTSTFIDGRVRNSGPDTLNGVTMQVLFRNDVALAPQVETLPLTLIRTHDPYVDTEPVSAAPLKPGGEAEFRLIFETVTGSWNQQMPELHVIHVTKR